MIRGYAGKVSRIQLEIQKKKTEKLKDATREHIVCADEQIMC